MSQEETKKVMIIVGNWWKLREMGINSDMVFVTKDPNAYVVRIEDRVERGQSEESIKIVVTEVMQYVKKCKPNDNILLFLHDKLEPEGIDEIRRQVEKERINTDTTAIIQYGGGKNYLYYNFKNNTGILDGDGDFTINDFHSYKDENSNETIEGTITVVDIEENTNGDETVIRLKQQYFDPVWHYYHYQAKKKLFEFQEDLLIYLIGKQVQKKYAGKKLADFLQENNTDLQKGLSVLLEEEWWNNRVVDFYHEKRPHINQCYKEIVRFIQTESFGDDFPEKLRAKFAALLKAMPERIYA